MLRDELITWLDGFLQPDNFDDYCPNGLQVEGKNNIGHLVSGVSASHSLISKAVDISADAILVHHGLFWRGEYPVITGMKAKRIKVLLQNDINLIAYHLPLDAHSELGNNAALAGLLGFKVEGTFADINSVSYAFYGSLDKPLSRLELQQKIKTTLQREPLVIPGSEQAQIRTVAWCSGAAQDLIEQAARLKADAYISGEISEHTVYKARELGLDYFAIGHHASERYGVQELGRHLADKFAIKHTYLELDNPV